MPRPTIQWTEAMDEIVRREWATTKTGDEIALLLFQATGIGMSRHPIVKRGRTVLGLGPREHVRNAVARQAAGGGPRGPVYRRLPLHMRCANCAGRFEADHDDDARACPYCGQTHTSEDARRDSGHFLDAPQLPRWGRVVSEAEARGLRRFDPEVPEAGHSGEDDFPLARAG